MITPNFHMEMLRVAATFQKAIDGKRKSRLQTFP